MKNIFQKSVTQIVCIIVALLSLVSARSYAQYNWSQYRADLSGWTGRVTNVENNTELYRLTFIDGDLDTLRFVFNVNREDGLEDHNGIMLPKTDGNYWRKRTLADVQNGLTGYLPYIRNVANQTNYTDRMYATGLYFANGTIYNGPTGAIQPKFNETSAGFKISTTLNFGGCSVGLDECKIYINILPTEGGTITVREGASNGTVVYNGNSGKFIAYAGTGTSVKYYCTTTADDGYEFSAWTECNTTSTEEINVLCSRGSCADKILGATFTGGASTTHTVSISTPEHGTLTVVDGNENEISSGAEVAENTVLTVTATPVDDYHFSAWTNDGAASVTVDGDKTIGATFAQNDYFLNATYGAGGASVARSDEGNNETVKRAGNTVTLTPTAADGYEFAGWSGDGAAYVANNVFTFPTNGTHNTTYNVQATFQTITYTVTFNDWDGTQLQSGAVAANTKPTISNPTRPDDLENNTVYTFIGWKSSVEEDENIYTTANLPLTTAIVTYTAQYEPYFLLLDDKSDNNDAYYTTLADRVDETLNVKYMRSFTKDTWFVFSLPFGYSYRNEANQTFRGQLYTLVSAKYTADGYLTLNCMPATTGIVANKPYILIPNATIVNPTFKNVKMKLVAKNYYTVQNIEGIGTGVEFRNTTDRETLAKDKRVIYLSNNHLYYPSLTSNAWMRPFRGYFYLNIADGDIAYSPARVRLVTPEGEQIEQLPETEETLSVETKKYIENGILVIERSGIKYDAQGHKIQ
ncbi:MAG: hypothetical protein J6T32_00155 [Paludibacteraceae bacterium]|nr:hypothetical protein [Paludibacteraceae bacterium]